MARRQVTERDGVRLSWVEFGGNGLPVVLLHGLAGHGGEWADTASRLGDNRVLAPDARGHGHSERVPADVSRGAHVGDVAFLIEHLGLPPVTLVGQSLGGHTAMLVAAQRPDLVRSLVIVEASPVAATEELVHAVGESLSRWPVPFPTHGTAVAYFGGPSLAARAWVDGLEQRDAGGGWWPRFEIEVMRRTLREAISSPIWSAWERIRCPTLIVRGARGTLSSAVADEMVGRLSRATLVDVPDAGHDVHLERPDAWAATLAPFLKP